VAILRSKLRRDIRLGISEIGSGALWAVASSPRSFTQGTARFARCVMAIHEAMRATFLVSHVYQTEREMPETMGCVCFHFGAQFSYSRSPAA